MRLLIPAMLMALTGCGGGSSSPNTITPTSAQSPPQPAEVSVTEVRGEELAAAIAKHTDKVVVVDLWAVWCESCVKKFPHFVSLQKKYGDKGLVCISVSMDKLTPATYTKAKTLEFLQKKDAAFPNYVVAEPELDEAALSKKLGDGYRLIPLMVIFDKAGRKIWASDDDGPSLTDAQLDKKIEDLLAK